MTKKHFLIVLFFNLIIALAFYIQGLNAKVTEISGDLANIIPICQKIDNPNLFKGDLYLNELDNVKYYIPFYVQTLRFIAKFTNHDYIQALNILGLITHFLYGLFWFLLFYTIKKNLWLAFVFSIFFRGVIWPPGMELLGISDLWTIMPRTVFIALIPIPFLIFKYFKGKWLYLSPLILGLLVNFHPISGVGCILVYLSLFLCYYYFENNLFNKNTLIQFLLFILLILIGMSPYLLSYLVNVKSDITVNQVLFNEAFHARIDDVFFDSYLFLKSWGRPVTYFFGVLFLSFYFLDSSKNKRNFKSIFISILVLLIFCNGIIFIENVINHNLKTSFRFSFQLIRAQKFVMVLMQIATFLLICNIANKFKINNKIKISITLVYILLISLSTARFINKLPLVGEDITTFVFPNNLKFFPIASEDKTPILEVHDFINKNTKLTDVFYARDLFFRTATKRAEVLDFHAAGMLIEGNQKDYTDLYFLLKKFKSSDENKKIEILKAKNVNYIIDRVKWNTLKLVFKNSKYYIYKL